MEKREHPILFSTEMVKAILDGTKTQTRRVIKIAPDNWELKRVNYSSVALFWPTDIETDGVYQLIKCPYGQVGDRLWVRETWCQIAYDQTMIYKADCGTEALKAMVDLGEKWKPSIHMPRWASRITLEITSIRVERLNCMSESDARAEGIYSNSMYGDMGFHWKSKNSGYGTAKTAFFVLWDSIHDKENSPKEHPYRWQLNPWVWVIEFKVV